MTQVKVISLVKAIPGQSAEEFARRWKEDHTPLTAMYKNLKRYVINLPNRDWHAEKGAPGPPFDGVAEMYWDSYAEMMEDLASPQAKAAGDNALEMMEFFADILCIQDVIVDR